MTDPTRRPPFPPFTRETAIMKVRLAEDAWNSRHPEKVAQGYTVDCPWRNRAEFPTGRKEIIELLTRKWSKELEYRLIKELWAFDDNIVLQFVLPTSSAMTPAIGFVHMETRIGNMMRTA